MPDIKKKPALSGGDTSGRAIALAEDDFTAVAGIFFGAGVCIGCGGVALGEDDLPGTSVGRRKLEEDEAASDRAAGVACCFAVRGNISAALGSAAVAPEASCRSRSGSHASS